MADILVAASPEPQAIVERILAGHDLRCATTLARAQQLLGERSFDLIVCTVAFDESMMFELLQFAKSRPEWERIPFACARVRTSVLRSMDALRGVEFTCRALGATAFVDIADYQVDPEEEMRVALEHLLDPSDI